MSETGQTPTTEELIVSAYKRGFQWCIENNADAEYVSKAARDYADKTMTLAGLHAHPSVRHGKLEGALRKIQQVADECAARQFASISRVTQIQEVARAALAELEKSQ